MIRINLGKNKKGGGTTKIFGIDLDVSSLISGLRGAKDLPGDDKKKFDLKNSPVAKAGIAILIIYIVQVQIDELKQDALKIVDQKIKKIEKQTNEIQAKLAEVKGFEVAQKQLEEDERVIRTKLETIHKLLETRNSPSKMMLYMAEHIPQEVWLTDLKATGENLKLSGATIGYSEVSDFIKALTDSSFLQDITISNIQESQLFAPNNGQQATQTVEFNRVQDFEITAKRRMLF